jgi:hypothetical protein
VSAREVHSSLDFGSVLSILREGSHRTIDNSSFVSLPVTNDDVWVGGKF